MKFLILCLLMTSAFAQTSLSEIKKDFTLISDKTYINDNGDVFIHGKRKFYYLKTFSNDLEQRQVLIQGKIGSLGGKIKKDKLKYTDVSPTGRQGEELAQHADMLKKLAENGELGMEHIGPDAQHLGKLSKVTTHKRVLTELAKPQVSLELIDALEQRVDRDKQRAIIRMDRRAENAKLKEAGCKRKLRVGETIVDSLKKSSAFITTHLAQPFVSATGFVSAFFDKKKTGLQQKALFQMINNNLDEINAFLIVNQDLPTEDLIMEVAELMAQLIEQEVQTKYAEDLSLLSKDLMEQYAANQQISAEYINNHPNYQGIKALSGDISQEQVDSFIEVMTENALGKLEGINWADMSEEDIEELQNQVEQDYEKMSQEVLSSLESDVLDTSKIKSDGIIAGVSTLLVPSVTAGLIFSSVGAGLATGAVILAAGGTTALVAKSCLKKADELDQRELAICGYVVNRTARHNARSYVKAKASGFRSGANYRAWRAKRKAKRKAKK